MIKDYKKKGDGLGPLPDIAAIIGNPNLVHLPYPNAECEAGAKVTDGMQKALYHDKDYVKPK